MKTTTGMIIEKVDFNTYEIDIGFKGHTKDIYRCSPLSLHSSAKMGVGFVPSYNVDDFVLVTLIGGERGFILGGINDKVIPLDDEILMTTQEGAMVHLGARPEALASGSSTGNVTISGNRVGIVSGAEYKDWALQTNRQYIYDDRDEELEIPLVPEEGVFIIRKDGEDLVTIQVVGGDVIISTTGTVYINTDDDEKDPVVDGDTIDLAEGTGTISLLSMIISLQTHTHPCPTGMTGPPVSPDTAAKIEGTGASTMELKGFQVDNKTVHKTKVQ